MSSHNRLLFSFIVVLLPILLYSIFRFSIGPLLGSIENQHSFSNPEAGILLSSALALTGIGVALSSPLSRKYGETTTASIGLLVFSIALAASVLLENKFLFSSFFSLSGLGAGLMTTPTYSLAATLLPNRKGTAIGFVSAAYNLGGLFGPAFSGFLLNYFG